jgi:predicted enzyme related to lactoylglutathione lyase
MSGKVIGVGGIFMRFQDPERMNKWYEEALGLKGNGYGVLFAFNGNSGSIAFMQLGTFPKDTDYFGDQDQQYMINFRVENLDLLLERLKSMDTTILNEVAEYEYGRFVHIADPEGNRIELWEPIDKVFETETYAEMK